jgi:hypothetical protein
VFHVPSASTRSDNDIFIASKINSSSEGGEGCKRADYLLETHCYKRMLISQLAFRRKDGLKNCLLEIILNE